VGEWRPTPTGFANGINQQWATLTPFVLGSPSQFRAPAPPAVGSPAYTKALNEVKAIGTGASARHTAAQSAIADFYKQDAEVLVNEATRLLSASHALTLGDNALLFALVNIALADARIAVWDSKYFYKFWRPVTALNADPSGLVTNGYTAWTPYIVTPAHPSYPSGHSGTVDAGFEILRSYFGDFNTLTLHFAPDATGTTRTINSLTQGEVENGLSRIYGGIHYSFDNLEGQKIGYSVAGYVLAHGPHLLP
ncbi:MAG: vanadium-dependent haloperoxidase, partial [Terrimicrobiaceae bacterium]|nr:vanadium-dependent haloperoxidase [Terrimicrobiaceae bacterium]